MSITSILNSIDELWKFFPQTSSFFLKLPFILKIYKNFSPQVLTSNSSFSFLRLQLCRGSHAVLKMRKKEKFISFFSFRSSSTLNHPPHSHIRIKCSSFHHFFFLFISDTKSLWTCYKLATDNPELGIWCSIVFITVREMAKYFFISI